MSRQTIWSVQYLRAFAALSLLSFEMAQRGGAHFPLGAAGADLFFVISGVVVWTISEDVSPVTFWIQRTWRIVPLYWAFTLILFSWGVIVEHAPANVVHLMASLAFLPHPDWSGSWSPVLAQGWSINFYMAFYLLFGFCLLIQRRLQLPVLTGALVAMVALGVLLRLDIRYPMLLEFAAGAWLAEAWRKGLLKHGAVYIATGLAMLAWSWVAPFSEGLRPILWGLPAALIVAGALALEPILPRLSTLRTLGDASYSFFLTQGIVLGLAWPHLGWFSWVAVIAVAGLCHLLVERPLHRLVSIDEHPMFWGRRRWEAYAGQ